MSLKRYRDKRDFDSTPEPTGKTRSSRTGRRFVVHEHHASRLHFDLRLEIDGVLKSWAVPKGPSMNPADKRLAILVEDHPIEYLTFKGEIPSGQYGAGRVYVWDSGTFEPKNPDPLRDLEKGQLEFTLHGKVLKGGFALVEMKGRRSGDKQLWLLIKMKDSFADPDWKLTLREKSGPDAGDPSNSTPRRHGRAGRS